PLGAVPQARRAPRQKAGHSRRGPHYPDHPIPYVEEPTTVSRSWGGLLRSAKCRATQALANPQARAPRPSSHCSEPSFLSNRDSLSIFSREPFGVELTPDELVWLPDFEQALQLPARGYQRMAGKNDQELLALVDEQIRQSTKGSAPDP